MKDLVYLDEYNLMGINYYWNRRNLFGLSEEKLIEAGVDSDRVQVHRDIIDKLISVNKIFQEKGYILFDKEGYRPKKLYEYMYQERVKKFGKKETDRLVNMEIMPHASGKSVDVTLWDKKEDKEIFLRNKNDGTDALFVDFYKDKEDSKSKWYQEMQEYVINTMQDHGFRLGKRREYFHFDYKSDIPKNYENGFRQN